MKRHNWFWGVFFLAAGFFVVASQLGGFVHLGFWSVAATVLLAATLIGSLVELNFFGTLVSAALLYAIYQEPLDWPQVSIWLLLLTAIFISIGLSLIFRTGKRRRCAYRNSCAADTGARGPLDEFVDGDSVSISESFNEVSKYLHADCLRQANISASFGRVGVFFDSVKLSPNGAEIYVDVSFAKIELYLPKDWRVIDQVHSSAGSVSNNFRAGSAAPDAPVLTVKGRVSFGSLELRYI